MLTYHSRKYQLKEGFFSKWSPGMAYVLGFWFADGDMKHDRSYRIRFTSADFNHLVLIRKLCGSNNLIRRITKHGIPENAFELAFHSKKMYQQLQKLGGKRRKSVSLEFPVIPKPLLPDFLRGYFDGDGSVHKIKYRATKNGKIYREIRSNFTCGTKEFLEKVRDLLCTEIDLAKRKVCQFGPHQFKLGYSQNNTLKLMRYLYYTGNPLSLKRKERYLKTLERLILIKPSAFSRS